MTISQETPIPTGYRCHFFVTNLMECSSSALRLFIRISSTTAALMLKVAIFVVDSGTGGQWLGAAVSTRTRTARIQQVGSLSISAG